MRRSGVRSSPAPPPLSAERTGISVVFRPRLAAREIGYSSSPRVAASAVGSLLVLLLSMAALAQPAPQSRELTAPVGPGEPIAPTTTAFTDLKDYSHAEAAIKRLVSQGIMQGVSATQFAPGTANTRGDFA